MKRWLSAALIVAALLASSACSNEPPRDYHEVTIGVNLNACRVPGEAADDKAPVCGYNLGLDLATVTVMSNDTAIWTGTTDIDGAARAKFTAPGEWYVVASSPLLHEDLVSETFARDEQIVGFNMVDRQQSSLSLTPPPDR